MAGVITSRFQKLFRSINKPDPLVLSNNMVFKNGIHKFYHFRLFLAVRQISVFINPCLKAFYFQLINHAVVVNTLDNTNKFVYITHCCCTFRSSDFWFEFKSIDAFGFPFILPHKI